MSYLGCFDLRLRITLRTILKKLTGNPYSVSSTYGISVHIQDTKYTFYQNVLKINCCMCPNYYLFFINNPVFILNCP